MAIYLDNHATTPLDPRVFDAMRPYWQEKFGNPASTGHRYGIEAAEAVAKARKQIEAVTGNDVVFLSGATEANNLAIFGSAPATGGHMITTPIEHPAVLETARAGGWDLTLLPVDHAGLVDPDAVKPALRADTFLISVMAANNEVGTIQPIAEIGAIAREHGVWFHTDASQAIGKVPLAEADLISFTGHKIHGPVGSGALVVRPGVEVRRQMHGGNQEGGRRAGTLATPGIVGLGEAFSLFDPTENERIRGLRDRLRTLLESEIEGLLVNGTNQLPGNLHVSLPGVTSDAMVAHMPGLAVSAGAACHSGEVRMSPVLAALGFDEERAAGALRFGLGRFTTADEIEAAAQIVTGAWKTLRT